MTSYFQIQTIIHLIESMSDSDEDFYGFQPSEIEAPLIIDEDTTTAKIKVKPRGRPKGSLKCKTEESFHGFATDKTSTKKIIIAQQEFDVSIEKASLKSGRPKKTSKEIAPEEIVGDILSSILGDVCDKSAEMKKSNEITSSRKKNVQSGTVSRPKLFLLENTPAELSVSKLPKTGIYVRSL